MKKRVTVSTLGKRSKQQVLKDFVRPSPASTISSAISSSSGGYGGGNIPGCAGGIPEPRVSCGDLSDGFDRDVIYGWGGSGSNSLIWNYHCDPTFADDNGAFLTGCPGSTASATGSSGIMTAVEWTAGSWAGAYLAARIPYEDVSEDIEVLYKIMWIDGGDAADSGTQHALTFTVRAPDHPSGTASAGVFGDTDLFTNDSSYLYGGARIVWREGPSRFNVSYIAACNGNGGPGETTTNVPTGYFIEGVVYNLRIKTNGSSITVKFWKANDDESTAYQASRSLDSLPTRPPGIAVGLAPNFQPHDTDPDAMRTTVHILAVIVNPAAAGTDCETPNDEPGFYVDTLYRKQNYWRPQYTDVSYYGQVWFDGAAVFEGIDYTIVDGYKLLPVDSTLPTDTVVEAEIVVE